MTSTVPVLVLDRSCGDSLHWLEQRLLGSGLRAVRTFDFDATDLGLRQGQPDELRGGEPEQNAAMLRDVLEGSDRGGRRDVVLLNAAAALAAESGDLGNGLEAARRALDSGAALEKLDYLITFSQALGTPQEKIPS